MTAVASEEQAEAEHSGSFFLRNPWLVLGVFCLLQVCTTGDNSALSVATSKLLRAFDTEVSTIQIANTIYPLIAGATMVAFGMLGLITGWTRLLRGGVVLLIIGEVVAASASDVTIFIYVARVLTGLGASMCIPAMLALIANLYEDRMRYIAFAAIGAASGVAVAVAPILAGAVIDGFGWRWAFRGLAGLFGLVFLGTLGVHEKRVKRDVQFDLVGAVLIAASLVLFLFGLAQMPNWGVIEPVDAPFTILGLPPSLWMIGASIPVLWAFMVWETHREDHGKTALLPRAITRNPVVRAGLAMNSLYFIVLGGALFVVVAYLQVVIGRNAIQTGLVLAVLAVGMATFSVGTPMVAKSVPARRICTLGIFLIAASMVGLAAGLQYESTDWLFLVGLFTAGAGAGLVASQAAIVVTEAIPETLAEQSGGAQGAARNVGQALGIALGGVVLVTALTAAAELQVEVDPEISKPTKEIVDVTPDVQLMSDEQLETELDQAEISERDRERLREVNKDARRLAARLSVLSIGALSLLFLIPARRLPHKNPDDEQDTGEVDLESTSPPA